MNNQRRKQLDELIDKIEDIKSDIESLRDEEQEYFDNMPESLQGGEKGDNAQSNIDAMDEAISNLEESVDNLQNSQQ